VRTRIAKADVARTALTRRFIRDLRRRPLAAFVVVSRRTDNELDLILYAKADPFDPLLHPIGRKRIRRRKCFDSHASQGKSYRPHIGDWFPTRTMVGCIPVYLPLHCADSHSKRLKGGSE
jgi:hypothetical protein